MIFKLLCKGFDGVLAKMFGIWFGFVIVAIIRTLYIGTYTTTYITNIFTICR